MKECPHCSEVLPDEVKWCRFCKKNTEMEPKFGEKAKRLEALRNEIKGNESYIKSLEKVTHVFFSNKRKMINKAFSKLFLNYDEIAQKLNINLNLRPSELSCEDYYRITECYEKLIKKPLRL